MDIQDRSKRFIGLRGVATKSATTRFMLKCPGSMSYTSGPSFQYSMTNDRLVFGGHAFGKNIVHGDYIQIDCVDHDNILGAGVDYLLKSFCETSNISRYPDSGANEAIIVPGLFLNPDGITEIANPIPSRLYGGMWLRFSYVSVGTDVDPEIFININWDKQNT